MENIENKTAEELIDTIIEGAVQGLKLTMQLYGKEVNLEETEDPLQKLLILSKQLNSLVKEEKRKTKKKQTEIFKKDGVYWIKYKDPSGLLLRENTKTSDREKALSLLRQRKKEVKDIKKAKKIDKKYIKNLMDLFISFLRRGKNGK